MSESQPARAFLFNDSHPQMQRAYENAGASRGCLHAPTFGTLVRRPPCVGGSASAVRLSPPARERLPLLTWPDRDGSTRSGLPSLRVNTWKNSYR
jgi:hypothetical protein